MANKKYDVQSLKNLVDTLKEADKDNALFGDMKSIKEELKKIDKLSNSKLPMNEIKKGEQISNEDRQKRTLIVKKATEQAKDVREGEVIIDTKEEREIE